MLECWQKKPEDRPTFNECKRRIGQKLENASPPSYKLIKNQLRRDWPTSSEVTQSNPGISGNADNAIMADPISDENSSKFEEAPGDGGTFLEMSFLNNQETRLSFESDDMATELSYKSPLPSSE